MLLLKQLCISAASWTFLAGNTSLIYRMNSSGVEDQRYSTWRSFLNKQQPSKRKLVEAQIEAMNHLADQIYALRKDLEPELRRSDLLQRLESSRLESRAAVKKGAGGKRWDLVCRGSSDLSAKDSASRWRKKFISRNSTGGNLVTHRLVKAQELEVKTIAWVEDEGLDWIGKRIEERDKV